MTALHLDFTSALLHKYGTLEYILLGDLRDLLEEPANEETSKWLVAVLDTLLDMLPRQFALEESGGYLSEVTAEFPHWFREVEALQREHHALYASLQQLRDRVVLDKPFDGIADQVRAELRDWMQRVAAHKRHENRLVQTAVNLEVGAGD